MHGSDAAVATATGGIALALAVAALFVLLFRRFGQPAVIGEMTAGICLGPSVLGLLPGDLPDRLFPTDVRPYLNVASQLGLLLFMFILGCEFDGSSLRGRRRSTMGIWLTSIAVPMALGCGLAALIYHKHSVVGGNSVPYLDFILYLGVAMSITAFPVLARIIIDQDLQFSRAGALALALAAADDVLAWCMLAVVVGLSGSSDASAFLSVMGWSALYVVVMIWAVRPLLKICVRRLRLLNSQQFALLAAAGAFCSAYVTAQIGIHAIFGAFMFGMVMPRQREGKVQQSAMDMLDGVGKLLLPVFFVVTGLAVDLTKLTTYSVLEALSIVVVACAGKLGGVAVSAKYSGMDWQDSITLGVLMNTRGLTGMVLLNVGLSLGLLNVQLFSSMTLMALLTTGMAAPILTALLKRSRTEAFQLLEQDLAREPAPEPETADSTARP